MLCDASGGGVGRQSAAEHRKAVIDRLYSGDAALRHLETLALLDAEVWTLRIVTHVFRSAMNTRGCPQDVSSQSPCCRCSRLLSRRVTYLAILQASPHQL